MTRKTENETDRYLDIVARRSCEHRSKLQLSIFESLSLCSTGLVPNVLPRGDEGSGKPYAETQEYIGTNLNQEPPGQQSRVVTTIIPLFYGISRISPCIPVEIPCQIKSFDTDFLNLRCTAQ